MLNIVKFIFIFLISVSPFFAKSKETKKELAHNAIGLDVRSLSEIKAHPAPGSMNIEMKDLESKVKQKIPNTNLPIYVFCESGYRAEKARNLLMNMGYTQIKNIKSWRDWNQFKSKH